MAANILKKIMSRVLAPILSKSIDEYGTVMQMSPKERVYIANLLNDNGTFLEIGSGNSTLWFSQFAERIVSVESRKKWFEKIQKLLSQYNVTNV